jgi:hypothetical protein
MDAEFRLPIPDIPKFVLHIVMIHVTPRLTYGQYGQPVQILDMGETALDEQIFEEYLAEMREQYTADKVCVCFPLLTLSDHIAPALV